jgi:spermidine/putrescine transport system substrate-binding protein
MTKFALKIILLIMIMLSTQTTVAQEILYLYNWNNYISSQSIERFEARCSCKVRQDYYSDNEEMLAKLEAGASGYDVLIPTGNTVETLIRQQALKPLEKNKLRHLSSIKREFLQPWYDPTNTYSIPYAYSITLIGYNVEKMRELNLPLDSWALIFEPQYLKKLKGKITVLNTQKELMGAAMKYLGYSLQDQDMRKWKRAKDLLLRAKPYWAAFSNSTYIKDLAIGNIWVAHGYSNDMFRAREDAKQANRKFNIEYFTPKEGAVLAVDNMVLHRSGQHSKLAHQFIDFMLEGENSASLSNLIGAGNPNRDAIPYIRPEISSDTNIFPDPELMQKLEMIKDFGPAERRILGRMWTEIKTR